MPSLVLPAEKTKQYDTSTKEGYEAAMKAAEKHVPEKHLDAFRKDVKKASKKLFGY